MSVALPCWSFPFPIGATVYAPVTEPTCFDPRDLLVTVQDSRIDKSMLSITTEAISTAGPTGLDLFSVDCEGFHSFNPPLVVRLPTFH